MPVSEQHGRVRRSVDGQPAHVDLQFQSHGKPFHLRLKRDTSTFSSDLEILAHDGTPLDVDTDHLYEGYLLGKHLDHATKHRNDALKGNRIIHYIPLID